MPRISTRRRLIYRLRKSVKRRECNSAIRLLLSLSDSSEDEKDLQLVQRFEDICSKRYSERHPYRKKRGRYAWDEYLNENSALLNNTEFLCLFRLSRESFRKLEDVLSETSTFKKIHKYKAPRPLRQQLLVFLYRVGRYGSSGSTHEVSLYFGIGNGSVRNYVSNIVSALKELENEVVSWPSSDEREAMKVRLAATGFRHCIGIIDGTLIPLTHKPKDFHECYYSRKGFYAISALIVCDDLGRITYYYSGWPGSTHDNRVLRCSKLFKNRADYFEPMEYLLGDSAYSDSAIMVQSFKKARNEGMLPRDKELFNSHLARVRIKSEHCIGMLKGRFPCLRGMNTFIKHGGKEVKEVVDILASCAVLHNLLLDYDDIIPQEWYEELEGQLDTDVVDEIENFVTVRSVTEEDISRRDTVFDSIIESFA